MKLDDLHRKITKHYTQTRNMKNKKSIQIQSIIGQTLKRKVADVDQGSPYSDFLRNQKHLAVQQQPLYFRQLPRKMKCYFPGPPQPPPKLQQIPYTYEIVPSVPFKIPKQKPGYVGDWILQQSHFVDRQPSLRARNSKASKSMIQSYKTDRNSGPNKFKTNTQQRKQHFRKQVKKIASQMKQKNLSLKQIIKNKGMIKKPHNFYNSIDFFLMVRSGDREVESLLQKNPQLAFDVDDQQMTGLHWAAREGHVYICRILLQKYRANALSKDRYGRTPLHLAVQNKNIECIIRIFIEGGQMNTLNNKKQTVRAVAPDTYTKYLLQKLEQIRFIIKSKKITDRQQQREQLQNSVRNTLDESSLYF